jgi:hypothetical protein
MFICIKYCRRPTVNDPLDTDTAGPNNLQNFPVLNGQRSFINPALVQAWGMLDSKPNQSYLIQVFSNVLADSSGYGKVKCSLLK